MSPLQSYSVEIVKTTPETRVIGAAVSGGAGRGLLGPHFWHVAQ